MSFDMEHFDYGERTQVSESVADLLQLRGQLSDELAQAINDGDANQMLWLDGHIKAIGAKIFAAEVSSIKSSIEQMEARRAEVAEEIELLRRLKTAQNEKLQEALLHAQNLRADCGRTEVSLQFAENENHNLRQSIRTQGSRLEALKEAKLKEVKGYE